MKHNVDLRLIDRIFAAVQYADISLPHLDRYSAHWSQKDSPGNRLKDKIVAETALLWYETAQLKDLPPQLVSLLQGLSAKLRKEASHEHNVVTLLRAPHTVLWLGFAHILLSRLGVTDPDVDSVVRRALNGRYSIFTERLPFREMDARWTRGIAFGTVPTFEDILPQSIVMSEIHPIYMHRHDAYALTHALMYLTDFGRREPPSSLNLATVQDLVDATIAWQIWNDDLDLLAELLLCYHLLRCPWSAYAKLAWHVLEFSWSHAPTLTGPCFKEEHYATLGPEEATAYKFEHNYHTTYVGGLLCGALIRRPLTGGSSQPFSTPTATSQVKVDLAEACRKSAQDLRSFIEAHGGGSIIELHHDRQISSDISENASTLAMRVLRCAASQEDLQASWIAAVDSTNVPVKQLASVLYDAALIQTARRYDLAALERSLSAIAYLKLPPSRTILAATEFLIKQMLPCGALGAHFWREANQSAPEAITIAHCFLKCLERMRSFLAECDT